MARRSHSPTQDPSLQAGNQLAVTATKEVLGKGEARVLSQPLASAEDVQSRFGISGYELLGTAAVPLRATKGISLEGPTSNEQSATFFLFRATTTTNEIRHNSPHYPIEYATRIAQPGEVTIVDEESLRRIVDMNCDTPENFQDHYRNLGVKNTTVGGRHKNSVSVGRGKTSALGTEVFNGPIGSDDTLASREHFRVDILPDEHVQVVDLSPNGTELTYVG